MWVLLTCTGLMIAYGIPDSLLPKAVWPYTCIFQFGYKDPKLSLLNVRADFDSKSVDSSYTVELIELCFKSDLKCDFVDSLTT